MLSLVLGAGSQAEQDMALASQTAWSLWEVSREIRPPILSLTLEGSVLHLGDLAGVQQVKKDLAAFWAGGAVRVKELRSGRAVRSVLEWSGGRDVKLENSDLIYFLSIFEHLLGTWTFQMTPW